jgi:hypothetical protein
MKLNSSKKIVLMVSSLAALGVVGLAVWISGWTLTGAFAATSGSHPSEQLSVWDINITSDEPVSQVFTYNNHDGIKNVTLTLADNIRSLDAACNYEPAKDVKFYSMWGTKCELNSTNSCALTLYSGDNLINITAYPNHNRCNLNGTYSIGFTV